MVEVSKYGGKFSELSNYIALDAETTGLKPDSDKIIEIALVKVENNIITEKFATLVNPGKHIPSRASKINGIYDSDIEDAPHYKDIHETVAKWVVGSTIVAHNAKFDLNFIVELLDHYNHSGEIKYVDTLSYSKRVITGAENYKLQSLAKYLDIDPGDSHRALDDAITCHYLFQKCKEISKSNPMLLDAIDIAKRRKNISTSVLQKEMRLGYSTAAKLIDLMEDEGAVGSYNGSVPREVLIYQEPEKPKEEIPVVTNGGQNNAERKRQKPGLSKLAGLFAVIACISAFAAGWTYGENNSVFVAALIITALSIIIYTVLSML